MRGNVNVFKGSLPLFVLNVDIGALVDVVEVQPLAVDIVTAVSGGIIDEDQEVVGVVLLEDRVEVVFDAEPVVIVVTRCNDAHR